MVQAGRFRDRLGDAVMAMALPRQSFNAGSTSWARDASTKPTGGLLRSGKRLKLFDGALDELSLHADWETERAGRKVSVQLERMVVVAAASNVMVLESNPEKFAAARGEDTRCACRYTKSCWTASEKRSD